MRPNTFLVLFIGCAIAQPALAKLEVHEWGTFTSLVGSNGVTQPGLYHEDEALPSFVHPFGETVVTQPMLPPTPTATPLPSYCKPMRKFCMNETFMRAHPITQKMETPVLYFYSDRAQHVDANVKFPGGVVTETFPGPVKTSPTRESISDVANGDTTFSVDVQAPQTSPTLPFVEASNIYGHARNVASNSISSQGEVEKFIFYRGVGQYQPRFDIESNGGSLSMQAPRGQGPLASFLIDVDSAGDARLLFVGSMDGYGYSVSQMQIAALRQHLSPARNGIINGAGATSALVNSLKAAGLHDDEARAMIATWERGYLRVPGLRLLSVLKQEEVESLLPLTVTPKPDAVTRVFVSRIEILLDTEERALLTQVEKEKLSFNVATLGRFAEPKLHRLRDLSSGELAKIIDQLIERAANPSETSGTVSL